MKRTLYYIAFLILAVLLPIGCSEDVLPGQEPSEETVTWRFSVLMPESRHATRVMGETAAFKDLHLAVFSEVGGVWFLEELAEATAETNPTLPDQETEFTVTLNKASDKRKIHLIGNYPDLSLPFGDEGTLIGMLSVKGNHDAYWGCVTLDAGIGKTLPDAMERIPLVRNFAKVELEVAVKKDIFELTGFALHNVPSSGTVAPYNTTGGTFAGFVESGNQCQTYDNLYRIQKYEGNEPYDVDYIPLETGSAFYHTPKTDGSVDPFYIYERKNRDVKNPTSVIIKGKYNKSSTETFYKLDIIYHDDESNTNIYYNLLRNFIYKIKINSVTGAGYNNLGEALDNPASNNISGSTDVGDFTNISDGTGRLFVSTTSLLLTSDASVDIYYQYRPDLINDPYSINNTPKSGNTGLVTITAPSGNVLSSEAEVAQSDETDGAHIGWRKITLKPNSPTGRLQEQNITVAAGNLQRVIKLELRQPYNMQVEVTPETVSKKQGEQVTVSTSIPKNLQPSIFPLLFRYSTKDNTLYPLPGKGMYSDIVGNTYGFIYELDRSVYEKLSDNAGEGNWVTFPVIMQTNCEQNATEVYVDNQYFNRGTDYFVNPFSLGTVNVSYQRVGGRTPFTIYNGGKNNGSITDVTVLLNGEPIETTATVNGTQLVSVTIPDNFRTSDVVTFQFKDSYWWNNSWQGDVAYTATCTVGDLMTGTTLNFRTKIIEIPVGTTVDLVKVWSYGYYRQTDVYPYTFRQNNSTTIGVNVALDSKSIGTIRISRTQVTSELFVVLDDTDGNSGTLTFSFNDRYCTSVSNNGTVNYSQQQKPFTAECNVSDIGTNGFKITFEHPEP